MSTFIVTTKTKEDEVLLAQLLKKLRFKAKLLKEEEKEDYALGQAIEEGMRSENVSKEAILKALEK